MKSSFDSSFSFIYSKRPGTPASKLEDNTYNGRKEREIAAFAR